MSNLDTVIDHTKLFQGVPELQKLQNNPAELQRYLQSKQDYLYKDIVKQKDNSFQKVYGDLQKASQAQESALMYNSRTKEMNTMYDTQYNQTKKAVDNLTFDKNLASRKFEQNQWTIGNKDDTLFVYSLLFIELSIALIVGGLWRAGLVGPTLVGATLGLLLLIFVLTVVYRLQYTDVLRNKRYWDRKIFKDEGGKIAIPDICPGAYAAFEKDVSREEKRIEQDINKKEAEANKAIDITYATTIDSGSKINVAFREVV